MSSVSETQVEFWLHYVGVGLYKQSVFECEASKLGVQRAVPFNMLKNFNYGDSVLLAYYCGRENAAAEVFGYFTINGVAHNLPEQIYRELLKDVNVLKVDETPFSVGRACGSYVVGSTAYIDETLSSLAEKIMEVCRRHGVNPNKFKWFLTGVYHPFRNSLILTPAKFSRGYVKVKIKDLDLRQQQIENKNIVWIFDYERRMYLSKKERDAMLSCKLTDYS